MPNLLLATSSFARTDAWRKFSGESDMLLILAEI
jgi:hypothetical protein